MSGILKAIGRVFKKIAKVALPVIAIAAVALTGGAALGVLPALGKTLGTLGLSKALTGVLVTAAKGATFGAVGSLITGGNPLKGATTGLIAGGLLGGVNVALGGAKVATGAATGAGQTGAPAGAAAGQAAQPALDGAWSQFAPGADAAANAGVASAAPAATSGIGSAVASGGSIFGDIFKNPITAGMAIQGIGAGLSASSAAAAKKREDQQIRENYAGYSGLGTAPVSAGAYIAIDPATGRIVNTRSA